MNNILILEDEAPIREMLTLALQRAGFATREAADTRQAETLIFERLPSLILIDWMLPGISGIDFARQLKKNRLTQEIPLIMLTARGEEADKVQGLEIGADDYITKPFSPRELIARIKAVLRRAKEYHYENEKITVDKITLCPQQHRLTIADREVDISPTEFRLLHFFMTHPERVFSRSQVLDHVWGNDAYIEERTVDVHIRRLRKILADYQADNFIQTVRGVGYRFSTRYSE